MKNKKRSVFDGLLADNTVLSSCMVISPVIICGDTLRNAEALAMAFTSITLLSVLISSFTPKKLPYAVKIIIYAVISSLIYIPVRMAAQEFFPGIITRIGIYFPLLAVNSLIVVQTETKFFRMKRLKMIPTLLFYVAGFDAVILITAFIRELLAYGTINNRMVDADTLISGLSQPFGGFIFLGLLCGLYRALRSLFSSEPATERE
ncbi:MAG: electron transport complex subunit E [Ruminococcus sp.]|nr:electron transport complex subunit E [Ruminococcus sp.]MBQ8122032.1 electron transport complex subunit E [Ruminococcus sp.]HBB19801.1 electron transport complex subunit E [Ruminococcus sp.]HOO06004.1 Rnf-Nqr domain containing protein [Ruminococcus sp.]